MKRRVKQPDGHRQSGHDGEQLFEILPLHRQQLGKCRLTSGRIDSHDHLAHGNDPVDIEEHMLGPAKANSLRPEIDGCARIGRGFGVGANRHPACLVGPAHDRGKGA